METSLQQNKGNNLLFELDVDFPKTSDSPLRLEMPNPHVFSIQKYSTARWVSDILGERVAVWKEGSTGRIYD